MIDVLARVAVMVVAGLLAAQDPPKVPAVPEPTGSQETPAAGKVQNGGEGKLSAASTVDEVLDALHRRGEGLKDFTADVKLDETDTALGDTTSRGGTAAYQRKGDGDARMHVVFNTKRQGRKITENKVEYLLDNGWLTDRDYERKKEVRRQILRPGEKIDLLKLGEGPFPLPVGQPRESVQKLFKVTKVPADPKGDPEGTVHVKLEPLPDTQFARKFKSIDVWVDTRTEMPRRIETLDVNETTRRSTDLKITGLNQGLKDADFELPPTGGDWERHQEEYQD